MKTGMLWFDNDPKATLQTKIERAAAYYLNKYGKQPDICFVHPAMLPDGETVQIASIEIRPTRSMLPNHLWIGVNSDKTIDQGL